MRVADGRLLYVTEREEWRGWLREKFFKGERGLARIPE